MSRPRSRRNRPPFALDATTAFLARGLETIASTSCYAFARRAPRVAVTVLPREHGLDDVPDGPIPFDAWRLVALGYRLVGDGRGGLRKRAPLAIYRPRVDLPGTGRVGFILKAVFDAAARGPSDGPVRRLDPGRTARATRAAVVLHQAVEETGPAGPATDPILPRFFWAFRGDRPPVFESTYISEEWASAEVHVHGLRAWPAEMLVRRPGLLYEVHPIDGSPNPWGTAGDGSSVDDLGSMASVVHDSEIRDRWLRRGGVSIPLAQEPEAIFASLDHLRGRSVRNPAYAALRDAGPVARDKTYREWVGTMGRAALGDSALSADEDGPPAVAALRARIEAYAASAPAAEAGLLAHSRAGCEAMGIPLPHGEEDALQFLAGLVMSPWSRVEIRGAGAVQVVRSAGPGRLSFSGEVVDLDLGDLGEHQALYEPLASGALDRALRGIRARSSTRRAQAVSPRAGHGLDRLP